MFDGIEHSFSHSRPVSAGTGAMEAFHVSLIVPPLRQIG
jgi:hypothetical protein